MNRQYRIENGLMIIGPEGSTGFYIVANHIFGPGGSRTRFWINEVNNHIVAPNGADSGFWVEDSTIWGTGQAPWVA